jgi:predicted amidohydrolase YtcJ
VKLPIIGFALAMVLGVVLRGAEQNSTATLVLVGGTIYTANPAQPKAEALAIAGDRILRVGTRQEIEALRGSSTRVVDLAGATVVPGLEDAHGHVASLGIGLSQVDLTDTPDIAHIASLVAARAAQTSAGRWIEGFGWDQNRWPVKTWPTAADLDAVSDNHPVALQRVDGHAVWVNSRAMRLAGITKTTPDPPGGRLIRDASGAPTGVLVDGAQSLVERVTPTPTPEELDASILAADRELSRVGLTMVHDAGATSTTIAAYQRLVAARRLNTRLYVMISNSPDTTREWFARGPLVDPSQRLNVRAVKMFADGALGSRGAALLADYSDEPGNRGLLVTPPEALQATTKAAAEAGFQPCTHAIGDRANREMLDIYARVEGEVPGMRALRPRIEHAQILASSDVPRFAALGVIASMQPTHCTSDMPWAPARLGASRAADEAYVWQKLLKSGARLAAGSDFPVERPDPLPGFYAAITRQDKAGQPPDGWAPDQRLTRDEALAAFTIGAAYAAHAERDLGSLEAGKLADFVVLSRDIMTAPPAEILTTTVLDTVVGGVRVYGASNSPLGTSR